MILLLMGPPGSGKTTIGARLAKRLNYKWVDVDDHVLEPEWSCTVAEKLIELGEKLFLQEEGKTLMKAAASTFTSGSVISLTGSNPMDLTLMKSLKQLKNCIFVYLDVHLDDIDKRLGDLKVDRIVGASGDYNDKTGFIWPSSQIKQTNNTGNDISSACCGYPPPQQTSKVSASLLDILNKRALYYDPWFDVRIWPNEGATLDQVEENVLKRMDEYLKAYADKFTSSRCTVPSGPLSVLANTWGLSEAISNGLARDGGLYVPKHSLPKPTFGQMKRLVPLLYKHKAHIVLEKLIHHSQILPQKIDEAINAAFSTFYHPTIVPITYLEQSKIYLAELFHGPTGSFKDLALQLLPRLILNLLLPHEKHVYLVATSGDTGGAVIDGFSKLSAKDK